VEIKIKLKKMHKTIDKFAFFVLIKNDKILNKKYNKSYLILYFSEQDRLFNQIN